jgi:hypothetical protein
VIRLVADQNFNEHILNGLSRRVQALDIVRVRDVGLTGAEDRAILEWAAREGRVLLTHDRRTIPGFAYERVRAGRIDARDLSRKEFASGRASYR